MIKKKNKFDVISELEKIKVACSDENSAQDISVLQSEIKKHNAPYRKIFINFLRLIMFIFLIKFIRKILLTTPSAQDTLNLFFNSELSPTEMLKSSIVIIIVFTIALLIFYLMMFYPKHKNDVFLHPFVLAGVTFILVDSILIFVFPEVTISIIKAYLNIT